MGPHPCLLAQVGQRWTFANAVDLAMAGQHLFQQGRAAAREADDQNRLIAGIACRCRVVRPCDRSAQGLDKAGVTLFIAAHWGG